MDYIRILAAIYLLLAFNTVVGLVCMDRSVRFLDGFLGVLALEFIALLVGLFVYGAFGSLYILMS